MIILRPKIWGTLALALTVAGCGADWFPPTDPASVKSSNTASNTATNTTTTSVLDSTGKIKATNLIVAEISRDTALVTMSIKVDVTNLDISKTVLLEVVGKDSTGLELDSTFLSGTVNQSETKSLTSSSHPIAISIFPKITTWSIKQVTGL
jgi:hypothetical protein